VILWHVYPPFVGEDSGGDFAFVGRFFLSLFYNLQVMDIYDWSADDPVFDVGGNRVDSLACFDFLKEVIIRFHWGSCKGCQQSCGWPLVAYLVVGSSCWYICRVLFSFQVFNDKVIRG